jgi:carbon-monoxide dehydrogenase large subunit
LSILGTRVVRVEDPRFLTQGATYTDDLTDERLAGALHLTLVRSPLAHAQIRAVDTSLAAAAPGVVAVVTGADLGLEPVLMVGNENEQLARPCLATDVVRFVGEPVAAVLTEEPYQGQDAADLVAVEYEPLPAVFDVRDAVTDRVLLFPEAGTNVVTVYGDVQADPELFADCEVVVTQELVNQRVAAAPLEPRAAAAAQTEDGRVILFCGSQNAQGTKAELVQWLGIDEQQLRLVLPDVGGGFGAKIGAEVEHALVIALAQRLGRPVRWTESRSENMTGMTHGRGQRQTVAIGGDRDGRVRAYRLEVLADAGAYPRIGALLPELTLLMAPGTYDIDKVESRATVVVTNTTAIGSYRGAGRPEATQAIERAMDLFARAVGMDPAAVRLKNVVAPEQFPYESKAGALYDSGRYADAISLASSRRTIPPCAASRIVAVGAVTRCSWASGSPPTWRSPRSSMIPRRPRSRCTTMARSPC